MSDIRIQGLAKSYGEVAAVKGIDLAVERGEFVTLLGPSGSGKTTTLRMVAGLEQPDHGTVEVGGTVMNGAGVNVPAHRRNMGMVFQSYAVWPHKTVYDNVVFPLRMKRVGRGEQRARVERMLAMVGLPHEEYGRRFPAQLSGGQQQRVALARALVADPQVILYDEPLSNLDAKLRDSMRLLLRSIHDELGVTALYVTHDQLEAMVLSDRVCVMNHGEIVQQGAPRDLYERPSDLFVAEFIGQANVLPILEAHPRDGVFQVAEGIAIKVPEANRRNAARPQKLVIRHHQIRLHGAAAPGAERDNIFGAVVRHAMYLGDRVRYTLEITAGCTLTAEVVAEAGLPEPGATVWIELPGASCIVI
ncbi:MAG: ABC transporter ATP-binding protein [Betaproteobacteria bacterium]|nr:ABC transporter ATP-binding protein [Betaproteobacteria bacterium]